MRLGAAKTANANHSIVRTAAKLGVTNCVCDCVWQSKDYGGAAKPKTPVEPAASGYGHGEGHYERLLRRVAATKGLSRGRGLHRRRGILDSNRLGRVSSLGVAELESEAGNCAVVNRLSDCAHPSLGLRRYAPRNSGHDKSSGSASAPQSYPACRRQRDNFYSSGIFPVATRLGPQDRQVNRGSAICELEPGQERRLLRRWRTGSDPDESR